MRAGSQAHRGGGDDMEDPVAALVEQQPPAVRRRMAAMGMSDMGLRLEEGLDLVKAMRGGLAARTALGR